MTMSAPRSAGRTLNGELNVLSTDSSAPAVCAMPAIVAMSDTLSVGLAGVSMCTSFVFGRIASRTFCGSDVSTSDVSTPYFSGKIWLSRRYAAM